MKTILLPILFLATVLGDETPAENTIILHRTRGSALTAPPTVDIKGDLLLIRFVSSEETYFTISSKLYGEIDRDLMPTDGTYYTYDVSMLNNGSYTIGIENVKVAYTGSYLKEY